MSVGDVNSNARGSGARNNAGKPAFDLVPLVALEDCARVFDYGRAKYASWNWAKGMDWSIPFACMMRHLSAWQRGEDIDPESGLPHLGHAMCNLVMLTTYARTYPEGDDRTEWLAPRVGSAEGFASAADAVLAERPVAERMRNLQDYQEGERIKASLDAAKAATIAAATEAVEAGQGGDAPQAADAEIEWTSDSVADEIRRMLEAEVQPGQRVDLLARYAREGESFHRRLWEGVIESRKRGAVEYCRRRFSLCGRDLECSVARALDTTPVRAA